MSRARTRPPSVIDEAYERAELEVLCEYLTRCNGSVSETARQLRTSRRDLQTKLAAQRDLADAARALRERPSASPIADADVLARAHRASEGARCPRVGVCAHLPACALARAGARALARAG